MCSRKITYSGVFMAIASSAAKLQAETCFRYGLCLSGSHWLIAAQRANEVLASIALQQTTTIMASRPKARRMPPITKVTAAERAKQFSDDFYDDSHVLFCKYCNHSVDFVRIDTVKDHTKSKKHATNKTAAASKIRCSKQVTLDSFSKSKDLRDDFILDFVQMCTLADIPLEKADQRKGFVTKHCKQGGCLPQTPTLRSVHVPRLFEGHFTSLKSLVRGLPVCIIADETTDIRDHSILNVIAGVRGKYYLIDVIKLDACNHSTLSRAVIQAVTSVEIDFTDVIAFVSDSAAFCKKAFREVLSPIFPNALHVLCLAHILNLAGDVFVKWPDFSHTATLVMMVKSAFFKKPGRKSRYLAYLRDSVGPDLTKLPPVPVSTRWNSWFEAVIYHSTHLHLYEGFFKAEASQGMAVERIVELVSHKTIYPEILLQSTFISENCQHLISSLKSLEATRDPLACKVFNLMEDVRSYLEAGATKTLFGDQTDWYLSLCNRGKNKCCQILQWCF